MEGGKRGPSSFVQFTISIGRLVDMFLSFSVLTASSAPNTPNEPSNRPPFGTESKWLPAMAGGASSSRPARRANIFPISSIRRSRPASLAHAANKSLACLSASVSVRRCTPPPFVAPIRAISSMDWRKRSVLIINSSPLALVVQNEKHAGTPGPRLPPGNHLFATTIFS